MSFNRPDPGDVRRVACIGGGLIGSGWAACFLAAGYDVIVHDPDPGAGETLQRTIETAWPSLVAMGADAAAAGEPRFTTNLEEAVLDADFVQESAPERLDIKQDLYARLDSAMANDVVIASSTSGLLMSDIQAGAGNAARMVLGHPFNPPYLMPLVEVVGGRQTAIEAVDWACAFYQAAGKHPLKLDREVPGHVADRLQQAIWNEILHMIAAARPHPNRSMHRSFTGSARALPSWAIACSFTWRAAKAACGIFWSTSIQPWPMPGPACPRRPSHRN